MQAAAWVGLFQRLPADQHDNVMLMTTTGVEIVLQRIIRIDRDFMVALARLSGSTDNAKVIIIPYDQLTYLSFTRKLADEQIETVLGKVGAALKFVEIAEPAAPASVPEAVAVSQPTGPAAPAAETPRSGDPAEKPIAKTNHKIAPPSKSILLARLRQRLADNIAKDPGQAH